jgi:hypothetical protein
MIFKSGGAVMAAAPILVAMMFWQPAPLAAASGCDSLMNEFSNQIRPHFLRIVNHRNRDLGAYFRSELRRAQSGETPTRADIRKAYSRTRRACRNTACKTGSEAVYSATLKLYTLNRKWKNAGCPGYLKG